MDADAGLKLRVGNPVHLDVTKGRCRLHRTTMDELGLSPGAPVTITTDRGTAATYAYPADHGDWGLPDPKPDAVYVGLDLFLGGNDDPFPGEDDVFRGGAEADVGSQEVLVRPVSPSPADRVVHEALPPGAGAELHEVVSENVVGTLAVAGTRMVVHEKRGTGGWAAPLAVYETTPEGVVVVTDETELEPRVGRYQTTLGSVRDSAEE